MNTNRLRKLSGLPLVESGNKFEVSIEKMTSNYSQNTSKKIEVVEKGEFDDKRDAESFKKKMMKKYNLKRHAGHIVNYNDFLELFTNY